jgi:hypothetical protein
LQLVLAFAILTERQHSMPVSQFARHLAAARSQQ